MNDHIVLKCTGSRVWMGGREYTRNLIRAILRAKHHYSLDFRVSLLVDGHDELVHYEIFRDKLNGLDESESSQAPWTLANRLRWRIRRFAGDINPRLKDYLISIGTTFAYPVVTASPSKQPFRSAAWIPDFQYKHFPNGAPSAEIEARKNEARRLANSAQTVVFSSRHAESDFVEMFPQRASSTFVLRFRVAIEENAWQHEPFKVVQKYNLPRRFYLVSNLLAPTKNHNVVLEALGILNQSTADVNVVFTGDLVDYRNPGYYNQFLAKIHELGIAHRVRVLGLIPKADQFQLLRFCEAYVQPSLFEGWHTGVEESHFVGKRIIISNIPVHLEQEPPNAHFFDPLAPEELARLMQKVWLEPQEFSADREIQARATYAEKQLVYGSDFLRLAGVIK